MMPFPKVAIALFCMTIHVVAETPSQNELQQSFDGFRKGASQKVIKENLEAIRAAKEKAFPMLVRNLHREDLASISFQEAKVYRDKKTGEFKAVEPRMGHVALMLLEMELYGGVPKMHRGHEAFDSRTAAAWFRTRKSKSLLALQLDAALDSLKSAEAVNQEHPNQYNEKTVKFFSDRVANLRKQLGEQAVHGNTH